MPNEFLTPYVRFLVGAAYNVLQTLEGLGLWSTNVIVRDSTGRLIDSYWSASEAVLLPLLLLTALMLALIPSSILAGFCVSRRKGAILVMLAWSAPGVLSTARVLPDFDFVPETIYVSGTGSLGSPWGMVPLVALALLGGWVVVVVVTDVFSLKERFRHYYDYIWTVMAVASAVFFIADSQAGEIERDLQDATVSAQQASAYLLQQVREYDAYCGEHRLDGKVSCRWASRVQQVLTDYSTYSSRMYWQIGPKSNRDMYLPFAIAPNPVLILQIRRELREFNDLQCHEGQGDFARSSHGCHWPPAAFCLAFEPPVTIETYYERTVAIANECVVPSLVLLREKAEKAVQSMHQSNVAKHWRWLFYLWLATMTGGRLANVTARVSGVGENQRAIELTRLACMQTCAFLLSMSRALRGLVAFVLQQAWRLCAGALTAIRRPEQERQAQCVSTTGDGGCLTESGSDGHEDQGTP